MSHAGSQSASEIEREVEASRANLEGTVEALKDKMSVGQMVDEAARYFGEGGSGEFVSRLADQARSNPLPLALIGVGLAWLMSGRGQPHIAARRDAWFGSGRDYGSGSSVGSLGNDDYRRTFGESAVYSGSSHPDYASPDYSGGDADAAAWGSDPDSSPGTGGGAAHRVRDAVSSAAGGLGSSVSGIAGAVGGAASAAGGIASGLAHAAAQAGSTAFSAAGSIAGGAGVGSRAAWRGGASAYRGASQLGAGAYRGASRLGSNASRTVSGVLDAEPLILGALGIAVGAAIGALLPRTDAEDRYMGEARDHLREEAEAFAREKLEQGKAVAADAYRTVKQEAESQGLTTAGGDSVVDRLGAVARNTVERVRESSAESGLGNPDETPDEFTSERGGRSI